MYCSRGDNGSGAEDFWGESAESIRARYEARVKELEHERDEERAEVERLREWLSQRTSIVGTTCAREAVVSDTCIANHGPDGAASEACRRLRLEFGALLSEAKYQPGRRYHFALVVEDTLKGGA